ncbi:mitochondrial import inner membrane translocase subunit pam16 like 2 [Quercus suber]|uniref:Mitochondrial import inner membrane translocase subunit pam16 like 2 n=1 Tax=Quercus suber TaxID=58331 RepID=A0AAW0IYK2_QUESU
MAGRVIINLIVVGSGMLAKAFVQAYRQALANASKTGVAQETLNNTVRKASKAMTEQEARQILGVSDQTAWEEILKKYDALFERNAKNGSFYLQSKVHRAKECLEAFYRDKGLFAYSVPCSLDFVLILKYDALFERNAKNGSFYLQSKVHRAKECLEAFYRDKGQGNPS